jgi:predicted  nucleic acid-binding Zn-ribbon protein
LNVDWTKAESKPNAKQKVQGRFLLDLRSKINNLEKELAEHKKILYDIKVKSSHKGKNLEDSIKSLASSESDLKIKLSIAETRISELESIVKALTKKNSDLENTILNRNNVIEKLENGFERRIREIEQLKKEIERFNKDSTLSEAAPNLIKKIQNILLHKGFISDKEFYQLMNKIEEKYARISL